MDESGTTATGGGGGRGSSRTGGNTGMSGIPRANRDAMHIAQTLFPSTLCTAFVEVIGLLDDHAVSLDGTGVYEVAYQVGFSFIKSDHNIFQQCLVKNTLDVFLDFQSKQLYNNMYFSWISDYTFFIGFLVSLIKTGKNLLFK